MVKLSQLENGLAHIPPGPGMAPGWDITRTKTRLQPLFGVVCFDLTHYPVSRVIFIEPRYTWSPIYGFECR